MVDALPSIAHLSNGLASTPKYMLDVSVFVSVGLTVMPAVCWAVGWVSSHDI